MNDAEESHNAVPHMPGPGARLQAARESKSLSIEAVAAQLKLTRGTVSALESGQWEALHGRTYARGYFVMYVKFLGLPLDELLAQFNAQYTEPEPTTVKVSRHAANDDRLFPWLPVSLLVIVLVVCLLAYQHWSDNRQSSVTPDEETGAPAQLQEEPAQTQLDTDLIAPAEPALSTDNGPVGEIAPLSGDAAGTDFEPVEIDLSALEQPSDDAQSAVAEQLTFDNEASLTLTFNENSWVQVEDASKQVLISRVANDGETITLVGETPLSVQLGKAQGVEVIFNEQRVDISDDIVGNVARFTLGG